jgi:hypothetical protein
MGVFDGIKKWNFRRWLGDLAKAAAIALAEYLLKKATSASPTSSLGVSVANMRTGHILSVRHPRARTEAPPTVEV